jgi:monoamine oxidase
MKQRKDIPTPVDYAIIGGGVAGLYTAWRLMSSTGFKGSVRIFERRSRVGGRLITAAMPGIPFRAELGGMRFTNRHVFVNHTVEQLGLPSKDFSFDCKLMFLRGEHRIPRKEVMPYRVGLPERGKLPGDLVKYAIRGALLDISFANDCSRDEQPEIESISTALRTLSDSSTELKFDLLTPEQWSILKDRGYLHGSPLNEIGFWNLLQFYLTSEGFLFAHDGLGYESVLANWNAAEAIPWYLVDFDVKYLTLDTGMQSLPAALAAAVNKNQPYALELGTLVKGIQSIGKDGAPLFEMTLEDVRSESERRIQARNVIFALPKNALAKIDLSRLERGDRIKKAIENVTAHPLFKLFLGYERAWWVHPRALNCESGMAITDLPIRQVYYWGPNKAYKATQAGMLMASYSDAHYVDYWNPLHKRNLKDFYFNRAERTEEEEAVLDAWGVPSNMAMKAHRQVKLLHPELAATDTIPDPYVALVKEWPDGWHTWNVHSRPSLVIAELTNPSPNVFVCGEAFSAEQGWVEGALRSSERVLRKLGAKKPAVTNQRYQALGYTGYNQYIGDR